MNDVIDISDLILSTKRGLALYAPAVAVWHQGPRSWHISLNVIRHRIAFDFDVEAGHDEETLGVFLVDILRLKGRLLEPSFFGFR